MGKSGHVVGNIKAAELLVCGVFDGQCEVDVLEITPTGHVEGEVKAYKGQPKKWQILDDDAFSRDQIEKL